MLSTLKPNVTASVPRLAIGGVVSSLPSGVSTHYSKHPRWTHNLSPCFFQNIQPGVAVTVFSDNLHNKLHASDYADFQVEFPSIPITFITTGGIMHDRFIVLDYDDNDERIFHCGASSKDAAVKLTTAITEMTSDDMKKQIHLLIDQMKGNAQLVLR